MSFPQKRETIMINAKIKSGRKLTVVYEEKMKVIVVITAYWEEV